MRSRLDGWIGTDCNINHKSGEGTHMTTKERTAHANTQTFGLVLISAALLVAVLLTLILFDGEDIAFILVPTAAAAGAAFVTWRFDNQWARALGIVGTILSLGAFFLAFGLFHLFSPIEFIVALAYVLGFFMSLVGGVRALLAGRKGEQVPADSGGRFRGAVLAVIGVAAVISITGFLLTNESVDDSEAAGATVLLPCHRSRRRDPEPSRPRGSPQAGERQPCASKDRCRTR